MGIQTSRILLTANEMVELFIKLQIRVFMAMNVYRNDLWGMDGSWKVSYYRCNSDLRDLRLG